MNTGLISVRYAKALMQIGLETKNVSEILYQNGTNFYEILNEAPDVEDFFKNPIVKAKQKKEFVKEAFGNKFHEIMVNFIGVVIDNKRERLINDIFRNFLDIHRKQQGIKSVKVLTAISIDDK